MGITTFKFFVFLIISIILYYIFPKKHRWIVLLATSITFFLLAGIYYLILYMLFGIIITYIGARVIDEKIKSEKFKKIILAIVLISIVAELAVLKYINFIPTTINGISSIFNINFTMNTINLLAPLGISYYTLSLIGYMLDVYWTTSKAQKTCIIYLLLSSNDFWSCCSL